MRSLIFIAGVLAGACGNAQPVLNPSDLTPTIGEVVTYQVLGAVDVGAIGADVVWDYSWLPTGPLKTLTFEDPTSVSGSEDFPTATVASSPTPSPQDHAFYRSTTQGFELLGTVGESGTLLYDDPELLWPTPLTAGALWGDDFSATADVVGPNYERTGTSAGIVNGWGTLIMPFGTFTDVLRLERTTDYADGTPVNIQYRTASVYYLRAGLPGFSALFYIAKLWSNSGLGEQLVSANSFYLDPEVIGVPQLEKAQALGLYPVPAQSEVTLIVPQGFGSAVTVQVIAPSGSSVRQQERSAVAGSTLTVPLNGLAAGIYLVRISDEVGVSATQRLVVQ
jgi:Secretion system C-terminal sorting domain